nr:EOG090X05V1 [Leptodora kindtii]
MLQLRVLSSNLRYVRQFSALSEALPSLDIQPVLSNCRTNESNPVNHNAEHEGRFYRIAEPAKKQLFSHGGLPKSFATLCHTFNELCVMVRKPAVEVINYLEQTDLELPVCRYAIYGNIGTGKSLLLTHILHYGHTSGQLLVHIPWAPNWFRKSKEVVPSTTRPDKFDSPVESVEWLKHFLSQNGSLLQQLNLKTTETYTWSKREVTEEGSSWNTLLDLGLTRGKYATDCVAVLLKEIKKAAINKQCRVLVVIDGFNAFFSPRTRAVREDKSVILPSDFALTEAFLSMTTNDWNNGAVVVSLDPLAHPGELRESHLPRYLLGKEGFEHLDPFIPVQVTNYSEKEMHSQINYYIDRRWLQQPKAHTEQGRKELMFSSGFHPHTLMNMVAPY